MIATAIIQRNNTNDIPFENDNFEFSQIPPPIRQGGGKRGTHKRTKKEVI